MKPDWNSVPTREEVERRFREGYTAREAELWLAAELERGAELLRMEEPTSRDQAIKWYEAFSSMIFKICWWITPS